jgi:hypothetical protein
VASTIAGDVAVASAIAGNVAVGAGEVEVGGLVGIAASPLHPKPTTAVIIKAMDKTKNFFTSPPLYRSDLKSSVSCTGKTICQPSVKSITQGWPVQYFTMSPEGFPLALC